MVAAAAARPPATPTSPAAPAPIPGYQDVLANLISNVGQTPNISSSLSAAHYSPTSAVGMFGSMMDQANQANAQRGQDILGLLAGQGTAQTQQNTLNEKNQEGQINTDAVSRGLNNTTVVPNLIQGAQSQLALNNEQVTQNAALNTANMANSFSQQGPSMGLLAQLMAGGGGSGIRPQGVTPPPNVINPASMLSGGGGASGGNPSNVGTGSVVYGGTGGQTGSLGNAVNMYGSQTGSPGGPSQIPFDPFQSNGGYTGNNYTGGTGSIADFLGLNMPNTTGNPGMTSTAPNMGIGGDPLFGD